MPVRLLSQIYSRTLFITNKQNINYTQHFQVLKISNELNGKNNLLKVIY